MRLSPFLIFLILNGTVALDGLQCDLGSSDIIFLVKASHLLDKESFLNIKEFLKRFSNGLDLGRSPESTQAAIIFFDNIKQPTVKVEFSAYVRHSDLNSAIDNLKQIPCGTSWCKEKYNGNQNALEFALKHFPPSENRMKKVVIIQKDYGSGEDLYFHRLQTVQDRNLKILELSIRLDVITSDYINYNYYASYNDHYKRYMSRYAQLYPNVSIPQPSLPILFDRGTQYEDGRITVSDSLDVLKLKETICDQIFSCPVCTFNKFSSSVTPDISDGESNPTLTGSLTNFAKATKSSPENVIKSDRTGDYEYEIVADPPGMKINMNPVKDEVDVMRTTVSTAEYEYEDDTRETSSGENKSPHENSSDLLVRRKRQLQYGKRKQSECSCSTTESVGNGQVNNQIPDYTNAYNAYYSTVYSTSCNPPYICGMQSNCDARFYPYNCNGMFYGRYNYGSYAQQTGYTFPQQIQPIIPPQVDVIPQIDSIPENSEISKLDDGSAITHILENEDKVDYQERAMRKTLSDQRTLKRIRSSDSVLPDLLKPKAFSLNRLLSPFSSTSNDFLTSGVQPDFKQSIDEKHINEEQIDASALDGLNSKVKKPDGGSSLTHLDGLKSRKKRSYGFSNVYWGQPMLQTNQVSWLMNQHPRLHGVSTYSDSSNDQLNCTIRGMDIAIYVDDVSTMLPSTFELVKSTVSNLHAIFESNVNTCNEVSRLSFLKTMPNEEIKMFINYHVSTTSKYENDYLIKNLSYGGCDVRNLRCENSLPNAIVIGSNSLTIGNNDREKILVLISSRNLSEIKAISKHLTQAQDFAKKNNIKVIYVTPENGSRGVFSPTIRLKSLISTICSLSPKLNILHSKNAFCPWLYDQK